MENEHKIKDLLELIQNFTKKLQAAPKQKGELASFFSPEVVNQLKHIHEILDSLKNLDMDEKCKALDIDPKQMSKEKLERIEHDLNNMKTFLSKIKSQEIKPTAEIVEKEFAIPSPEETKQASLKQESKQKMKERKKSFKTLGSDEKWIPL